VDGEVYRASSTHPAGKPARDFREHLGGSGDVTTKQAAKALGVSRRSVQAYVRRGLLEAREEGEGVNRRFLISIGSLNDLLDKRSREANETANFAEVSPQSEETATTFANTGEGLRHLVERLEARTAEATELRIRLEATERAQSTLEDQRRRALEDLAEARRRQEEIEQERDDLRRELDAIKEETTENPESPGPSQTPPEGAGEAHAASESVQETQEDEERRGWFRRFFGF
jgi:chromosome segregation ATPase